MFDLTITSADNKLYKLWHSLLTSKGIDRHGLAIVSGRRIVPELAAGTDDRATLLVKVGLDEHPPPHSGGGVAEGDGGGRSDAVMAPSGLADHLPRERGRRKEVGPRTARLAPELFDALDEFGTHAPLLVLPVPPVAQFDPATAPRGLEILVAAQDPANLGAILRSAHAFGAARAILLQECAHAFLPKVTRAASCANFKLALARGPSIRAVEDAIALDLKGEAIERFAWPRDCRLLLGEEGGGIPPTFTDRRVAIPIAADADSLNVAVAAGIAFATYRRQHPL